MGHEIDGWNVATLASEASSRDILDWRVIEVHTGSDHQYITYRVTRGEVTMRTTMAPGFRWNVAIFEEKTLAWTISRGKDTILGNGSSATPSCPGKGISIRSPSIGGSRKLLLFVEDIFACGLSKGKDGTQRCL